MPKSIGTQWSLPLTAGPSTKPAQETPDQVPEDRAEVGGAPQAEASAPVGKRGGLASVKAMANSLMGRVALSMAGTVGAIAPETTLIHMLSSQFLTPALGTAARLGLMDALPATAPELAKDLQLNEDGVDRLMRACAAAGAVSVDDAGTFERTRMGELLTTDHPRSLKGLAVMLTDEAHWESWGQLEHSVRTGRPASEKALGVSNVFDHYAAHPEEAKRFNEGMVAISRSVTEDIGQYYDFSGVNRIIDIGGGHGYLLASALKSAPDARGTLFDMPDVVAGADAELTRNDVGARVDKAAGSFFQFVPQGGDVYMMKSILHDWNDSQCVQILSNIRKAMPDGSRLLIIEALTTDKPSAADFMNLHMMVMNGGKERSKTQFEHLLAHSGMKLEQVIPTAGPFHILEAVPA